MTVEEDVVGFQDHHSPLHLEGSGAVEVPDVISDDGPGTPSHLPLLSPRYRDSNPVTLIILWVVGTIRRP